MYANIVILDFLFSPSLLFDEFKKSESYKTLHVRLVLLFACNFENIHKIYSDIYRVRHKITWKKLRRSQFGSFAQN